MLSEIIQLNRVDFGLPMLSSVSPAQDSPSELELEVNAWFQLLSESIPPERVKDVYGFARYRHESKYPISPSDMRVAFKTMRERETFDEQQKANDKPKENCSYTHNNEEEKLVELGSPGNWHLLPCPDCRPVAYRQRCSELLAKQQPKSEKQCVNERIEQIADMRAKVISINREHNKPIDAVCGMCKTEYTKETGFKMFAPCACGGQLFPKEAL